MIWHHRFLLLVLLLKLANGQNQHVPDDEIVPFHLYNNGTMVEFSSIPALNGIRFAVSNMFNESDFLYMYLRDPKSCLPRLFLQHSLYNSSIYPLEFVGLGQNVTFFNCSSAGSRYLRNSYNQLDTFVCPIVVPSEGSIYTWDVASCTVMFQVVSPITAFQFQPDREIRVRWYWPQPKKHKTSLVPAIVIPGSIMLVLLFIVSFYIYHYLKKKGEDQKRLEKFMKDYKAIKPTRFSYADLKRITNHFKDKIGEGAHGTVFKGKLSSEIQVAVKILNNSDNDGQDFINEMGTMGKIHHINIVRLLGFCADGFYRALVYNFFPNGSLQKFMSSPDNKENFLGWLKLQQLALGIARGIDYLHQGCDYRILHFDINPHNVLLDHNFIPKISDFGLAKLCSKNQSTVSMTAARGTLGYIAPEVFSQNFGKVSYKSDIYSYGMLLLEMVGGRKNVDTNRETFQVLYPGWIHNLLEGRDTNVYIEDDDDNRIAKKLAIVGLWCIQWHPISRPPMKMVIQMLEGEVDKLELPPTPFDNATSINSSTIIPTRHLNSELEVIPESE